MAWIKYFLTSGLWKEVLLGILGLLAALGLLLLFKYLWDRDTIMVEARIHEWKFVTVRMFFSIHEQEILYKVSYQDFEGIWVNKICNVSRTQVYWRDDI